MKNISISIVIPAYNEETNIRLGALEKVSRYLSSQTYTWEVLIVNDGSTDQTKSLIEEFVEANNGFFLIDNPHQGKAATVITGVMAAKGTYVLFSDLDQATPLKELEKLLPVIEDGADVVIGSRKEKREGAPLLRLIMARGFMLLRTLFLGLRGIRDTQCGFKIFKKHAAEEIFRRLSLYGTMKTVNGPRVTAGFDIEVLFVAKRLGYTIKEIPVEWHYVETRRVNPVKDSWQAFMDILTIRWNAWRGLYGKKGMP